MTAATELVRWIDGQARYLGDSWVANLEPRKQEEASFHDADREGHRDEVEKEVGNRRWYQAAEPVHRYFADWIAREAPGRTVLDYACGNGDMAIRFARAGAAITVGIDISEVSVRNAAENAERAGCGDRTRFLQRDCEATTFPADSFDRILCSGMLHHLDLNRAFPELFRILRPGGRVLCAEALDYNPAIKLYRRLTPQYRTEWETQHILSMRDVRVARRWFRVENLRFFLMAAPLATVLPAGPFRQIALGVGHALDGLLTRVPLLRLWSWQFSFELVKPAR
jgi:SAM-dependent methyltransferase